MSSPKMKVRILLIVILAVNFWLNVYGNHWGLPSRWHVDEKVVNALHMAEQRTLVNTYEYFYHPTTYPITLMVSLAPYFAYLKIINYPIEQLKSAARVSWLEVARSFPDFAASIYVYSRTLSAIFGTLTVLMIFLLANRLYGRRAGIFSAASLAVCMGFIGTNHLVKYFSLLNFLVTSVILLCVISLTEKSFKEKNRYMLLSFFFSGLAVSTQYIALLLSTVLLATFLFNFKDCRKYGLEGKACFKGYLSYFMIPIFVFIAGFLIGTPTFITHFPEYISKFVYLFSGGISSSVVSRGLHSLFIGPINYFFEIWSIYGFALFLLILYGSFRILSRLGRLSRQELIVFIFLGLYLLIATVLNEDKYPQVKYIITAVPFLALLSGIALNDFWQRFVKSPLIRNVFLSLIFSYSFLYSLAGDRVFVKDDTRYKSTEWIENNIPKGAKIELYQQLGCVASEHLFYDYNFIYFGKNSKVDSSENFFLWHKAFQRNEHVAKLNREDSDADYFIVSLAEKTKIYSPSYWSHIPGLADYLRGLFAGKKRFRLVKVIRTKNKKMRLDRFANIVLSENLLWNPVPLYDSTGRSIYIFEKSQRFQR